MNSLTDYTQPLQPNAIDIRTEYLEPITSSNFKYVFRLDQMGYLDTNSMLTFKLQGGDQQQRVNLWNGALGGIKRVIFQVGDNIINDVRDVYKYSTLKNMNMNPNMRNGYLGHYLGNQLWSVVKKTGNQKYRDLDITLGDATGGRVGDIEVEGSRSGAFFGKKDGSGGQQINSHPIYADKANNYQYGIPLGMLIPALKGQRIPLFLFDKQRILITIEFNGATKYINHLNAAGIAYAAAGTGLATSDTIITPADVRLVVDYLVVPTDTQNEIVEQTNKQGGYKLEFYDVVNVEKNIPQGTNGQVQSVEHRIGQNGREVHNIIMWKEVDNSSMDDAAANHRGQPLFGKQACKGFSKEEYNCNIDGVDLFDEKLFNPISQYNEMGVVLGKDLMVDRPLYVCDDNTYQSQISTLANGAVGNFKPLGVSLRNGEPLIVGGGREIGNYPIVWKYNRTTHNAPLNNSPRDDHAVKVNYFIEVSRVASIMNTQKGMNVMVSY